MLHRARWASLALALALAGVSASAQIDPRTALLERAGWDALAAGRPADAATAFAHALDADPGNAQLHLGAGLAASDQQLDQQAEAELRRALELDPTMTPAEAALGRVLYRRGDLPGAIGLYRTLAVQYPDNVAIRDTLGRWQRELDLNGRMQTTGDPRFTISFDGPAEAPLVQEVSSALDRAYWRIGQALDVYPSNPVPVVLYTDQQFTDITRSPRWSAAAYDGTIRVPVGGALDEAADLDRVLAHELTHAMVRSLAPHGVPAWLNEGLASALEATGSDWAARARAAGGPVRVDRLPPSFAGLSDAGARVAYASSALAVERLLALAGGAAIVNLLRDLGSGVDFDTAFAHRISESFADFAAGAGGLQE